MKTIHPASFHSAFRRPSTGLAGYVFAVLQASAVPGSVLVPLLVDLGLSPGAVRTMLHRMVVAGSLSSEKVGRVAVYRLTGGYAERFRRFRAGNPEPAWPGHFSCVLYDIAEVDRRQRDELRDAAFRAGFGVIRPGVLIGLADPYGWCRPWLGVTSLAVEVTRLGADLPTARRLAERAWGLSAKLPSLVAFEQQLSDLADRLDTHPYTDREVFGLQAQLWEQWVRLLLTLPALPAELTPTGWPVAALSATMTDFAWRLQPQSVAHAVTVSRDAERVDLMELLPEQYGRAAAPAAGALPRRG